MVLLKAKTVRLIFIVLDFYVSNFVCPLATRTLFFESHTFECIAFLGHCFQVQTRRHYSYLDQLEAVRPNFGSNSKNWKRRSVFLLSFNIFFTVYGIFENKKCVSDDSTMTPRGFEANLGLQRRRGAIKHARVHEIRGHQFVATFFRQLTFCSLCSEFMW